MLGKGGISVSQTSIFSCVFIKIQKLVYNGLSTTTLLTRKWKYNHVSLV